MPKTEINNENQEDIITVEEVKNWKEIHDDFTKELQKEWEDRGFSYEECKKWINIGLTPQDSCYCAWLKNSKKFTPSEIVDKIDQLKTEYHSQQSEAKINNLIQVQNWDQIPYQKFTNIEYLAEGGFSKVYKAKWTEKPSKEWVEKEENKQRVVLKNLNDSQTLTSEFLREIVNHKLLESSEMAGTGIVKCYGISRDPKTGNHLMVMDYAGDSLREIFQKSRIHDWTEFEGGFSALLQISMGLKCIHEQGLIHKDFHSGNILIGSNGYCIADLGLCYPVGVEREKGVIYGVLPYVAPEVLQGKPYTQASDIYSFGIIAYELFSGLPSYYNMPHDDGLAIKICQGLRPKFPIKIPQLSEDLIKRCWDADPLQRPSAEELLRTWGKWRFEIDSNNSDYDEDSEIYQQFEEAKTYNETIKMKRICGSLSELYKKYKGQVREVKLEELNEIGGELFTEFCQKNGYEEGTEKARKEFKQLLLSPKSHEITLHPETVWHSKLINTKEITSQLQKLQEGSKPISFEITDEEIEQIAQIEQPSK